MVYLFILLKKTNISASYDLCLTEKRLLAMLTVKERANKDVSISYL